ncbi:MAG: flagellar hook-basal body complex protein FliE [Rhodospirillales bacterium]
MPTPAQNIANVAAAYRNAAKGGAATGLNARDNPPNSDFANLVKGAIEEAVRIGEQSESMSIKALNDKADLNQVVTAVAEAELTLQTVVAVRDKVLEAYKEIIRMPM